MTITPLDDPALDTLVQLALAEDGVKEDVTAQALVPPEARGEALLIAREPGVLAGIFFLEDQSPLRRAFPGVHALVRSTDGARIHRGDQLALLVGPARELLAMERTLLNFLQRLSGIASETARYVAACEGTSARIQETRKTCPGFRSLDKYAVRMGGGLNHRQSLSDQVLIKENHLVHANLGHTTTQAERAKLAVRMARSTLTQRQDIKIEVEVETLLEFDAVLPERPDIIMLDDFSDADTEEAVRRRNRFGETPLLEVSGGIRLERVADLAGLGVDRISVGALTHSVRAMDLALKIIRRPD